MDTFAYPSDAQLVERVFELCDWEYSHHGDIPGGVVPRHPTRDQLSQMLECSFAASLETEEGRAPAFTVSFFGDQIEKPDYPLKKELALSPKNLARLAVAFDAWRTRICVQPSEDGLCISGFIHVGDQLGPTRLDLSELSVRVLGPGTLTAKYCGSQVLVYRRGKVAKLASHIHDSTGWSRHDAINVLTFTKLRPTLTDNEQLSNTLLFREAMVRISRAILGHRHGGTLLIVTPESEWEQEVTSSIYAPSAPAELWKEAYARQLAFVANPSSNSGMQPDRFGPDFSSGLEWLAHLTATDGMTVILPGFTLLGFGVFFAAHERDDNPTTIIVKDPFDDPNRETKESLSVVGGARHQSAVLVCRRLPGSRAMVASQDGRLSSMMFDQEKGAVVVFRHLELLLDV